MKKALIVLWSVVLLYGGYTVIDYVVESKGNKNIHDELRNYYYTDKAYEENFGEYYEKIIDLPFTRAEKIMNERFKNIISVNPEVVGWIKIGDTRIDYPVVKTENNEYYLNHNIYKESSRAGSVFMDYRNDYEAKDLHTILYGHTMKDGSMFTDLIKYKSQEFYLKNPVINFSTLYEDLLWEIFSIYVTDTEFYYIKTDFESSYDYKVFIEKIRKRSLYNTGVTASEKDNILTLSTCSYDFKNARLVIHARKIHD
jgi:sortase B